MSKKTTIKIVITVVGLAVAISHVIWPDIKIDAITVTLIAISIIPWLEPLFKSIELPGGTKLEFKEQLEKVEEKAQEIGIDSIEKSTSPEFDSLLSQIDESPEQAFREFRVELEKSLRNLLVRKDIPLPNHPSIRSMADLLFRKEIITQKERAVLFDILPLLNKAIHGEDLYITDDTFMRFGELALSLMSSFNQK
ncbi:hypothetical protein KA050_02530 [Candidatus Gracilibacteria bacterium]|nr:hypothetical protein [Candidatus Gracilibacteria bacterium]